MAAFDSTIEALNLEVAIFRFFNDLNDAEKLHVRCTKALAQIDAATSTAATLCTNQELLQLPELDFGHLQQMRAAFDPFAQFWQYASNLAARARDCIESPLVIISIDDVRRHFEQLSDGFGALIDNFNDLPKIQTMIHQCRATIDELREKLELLELLKSRCWTRTCFERFGQRTGCDIVYSRQVSLGNCLEAGMLEKIHVVKDILKDSLEAERLKEVEDQKAEEERLAHEVDLEKRRKRRELRTDI